ncbi:MAG: HIRAN domain-containing protein, partial [Phycisphaerales bacterium]|nr:HIRAN domain-containing protein [Phycisphaerales bacterium]
MLSLVPEPSNPHDANAVQVLREGDMVGYLPREVAAKLVQAAQEGRVIATVNHVHRGSRGYHTGIELNLEIASGQDRQPGTGFDAVQVDPLLEVLAGDVLGRHGIDEAVQLGATLEKLRQALTRFKSEELDAEGMMREANEAAAAVRAGLVPGSECPDALRVAGVAAVVTRRESLGIAVFNALREWCGVQDPVPGSVLKLLSLLKLIFEPGDEEKSEYEKVVEYIRAAEAGNSNAMSNLGICYYKGKGVAQDHEQAV